MFWTLFRMLCHGDIFSLSHSNKNITTCLKIKCYFMWHKKIILFLVHHKFLYSNFTLHIGSMLIFFMVVLETKKRLVHLLLNCLINGSSYQELLWKKRGSCCLCLIFVKHLWRVHILVKLKLSFPELLQKVTPWQVFFENFTQILSNFVLHVIFPEDFPVADTVSFKISFQ